MLQRTEMWNMVGNGGVKYGGERLMRNLVGNFDVECSKERWCEIWWRTVTWNAPEKGYVKCGGEL